MEQTDTFNAWAGRPAHNAQPPGFVFSDAIVAAQRWRNGCTGRLARVKTQDPGSSRGPTETWPTFAGVALWLLIMLLLLVLSRTVHVIFIVT